jgi:hypothetical protein
VKREPKRITVQLRPEHVELIREALKYSQRALEAYDYGQSEEMRVFADQRRAEQSRLREEVLTMLTGRAVR